jgi:RNA polymerase primary sigma factor
MLTKINRARKQFQQETGRVPSVPELAHYLEMPVNKLQKYADSSRNVVSLELPVRTSGGVKEDRRTLGDRLASDAPTPEEDVQIKSLRQDIRAVVNELAARERDVVVCRFGLDDGEPRTVEESAKLLGISRDRVRLIEARALNKLRHPQRNYRLKDYVGGDDAVVFEDEATLSPERIWSF